MISDDVIALLRCPMTGQPLHKVEDDGLFLATADGRYRYPIKEGIAMLLANDAIERGNEATHTEA